MWEFKSFPEHNFDEADYFAHHRKKFEYVKSLIDEIRPQQILDVGAGVGSMYSFVDTQNIATIAALEIVDDYISVLTARGITAYKSDLDNDSRFPVEDGSFDLVVCDSILEHTLRPKWLLQEAQRVLKKDGHLILVVPNATSARMRWSHFRGRNIFRPLIDNLFTGTYLRRCSIFYSPAELREFVGKYFKIKKMTTLDETSHDQKNLTMFVSRMLSRYYPDLRDVVVVVCKK